MGLKVLGRVGAHIFFYIFFFLEKNKNECILKGISPFEIMHKIVFFQKTWKTLVFTSKCWQSRVT